MYPAGGEVTQLHYLLPPNPSTHEFQSHYSLTTTTNPPAVSYPNNMINHQLMFSTPHPTCTFSSNSTTSDEADEQQVSILNERKQRRMISNRESARRSRMRKQSHLDELRSRVAWLLNKNQVLMDKLNHVSERHDIVVKENVQLKEEASELRQMMTDMRINSPFPCIRDVPCSHELA